MPVYLIIFILSIVALFFYLSTLFRKIDFIPLCILSIALYLAEYAVISGILFTFDIFMIRYAALIPLFINIILLVIRRKKLKEFKATIQFRIKSYLPIILILAIFTSFTIVKNVDVVPSYDAGVYGQKTIDLLYGDNSSQTILEEFNSEDPSIKASVSEMAKYQNGLYRIPTADSDAFVYEYHAFPTWPALMGLWAKMFGLNNFSDILSLLFLLAGFLIFFITKKLSKIKLAPYLAAIAFSFAPLTINMAKNALSEMSFVTFVLLIIYLLLQLDYIGNKSRLWAIVPLAALCFLHITTLIYMPIIILILLYLDVKSKDSSYSYVGIGGIIAFIFSMLYVSKVSSLYSYMQYLDIFPFDASIAKYCLMIAGIFLVLLVVWFAYLFRKSKNSRTLTDRIVLGIDNRLLLLFRILIVVLIVVSCVKGYLLSYTDYYAPSAAVNAYRELYVNQGARLALPHLNIVTIIQSTCYFVIPYLLYKFFSKKTEWTTAAKAIALLLLYSLLLNIVIKTDSPRIYYIARYFIIFLIPAAVLLASILIKNRKLIICFICIALATSIPFNIAQMTVPTYLQHRTILNASLNAISQDSVVLLEEDNSGVILKMVLPNSLRNIKSSKVYSFDIADEIIAQYKGKDIYFITSHDIENPSFEKISTTDIKTYDNFYGTDGIFPLQVNEDFGNFTMYIYKYTASS